jgi:hypothetical protein
MAHILNNLQHPRLKSHNISEAESALKRLRLALSNGIASKKLNFNLEKCTMSKISVKAMTIY